MMHPLTLLSLLPSFTVQATAGDSLEFSDNNMRNVTQLTADGDNGEAYFNMDGKKLVFGSNRKPDKPRATNVLIADWEEK